MRFRVKILVTIFTFFLFVGNIIFNNPAQAQRGRCGNETPCVTGGLFDNCLPLPTTLPAVSATPTGGVGFRIASESCGARSCYWLLTCSCGPGLAGSLCGL